MEKLKNEIDNAYIFTILYQAESKVLLSLLPNHSCIPIWLNTIEITKISSHSSYSQYSAYEIIQEERTRSKAHKCNITVY